MRKAGTLALLLWLTAFVCCAQIKAVTVHEDFRTGVVLRKVIPNDKNSVSEIFSHPSSLKLEDLKFLLSTIKYTEKGFFSWSEVENVFSAEELYRLTPHLVEAFSKAAPDEEIVFRLASAKPGAVLSSERFTSGVMFVKDNKLNCLFANVNIKPNVSEVNDGDPRKYHSGLFWKLEKQEWQTLFEDSKGIHYNWIILDVEAGLAEKKRAEQALRQNVKRRRFLKTRPAEGTDWQDWQPDEAIPQETAPK